MKVLIIEDEPALRQSIQLYLEHQGFVCEAVADFLTGIEKIHQFAYDCVVVDIGLPYGSGLEIVKELKVVESKTGIIIISAKNALEDKLKGLELGSDDYLTKPFHLSELNARIHAIIRRMYTLERRELAKRETLIFIAPTVVQRGLPINTCWIMRALSA